MHAESTELVVRLVRGLSSGDVTGLRGLYAMDYVDHDPLPGQPPGRDGVEVGLWMLAQHGADIRFHLEDCFGVGDRVAYRIFGAWTVPHDFAFQESLLPRRSLTLSGVGIFRCFDGLFAERWGVWEVDDEG